MSRIQELRDGLRPYVEIYREIKAWFLTERPDDPLVIRCLRELLTVDTRDRILMLSGQAFIALMPALIVIATIASAGDGTTIANYVINRFQIQGQVAETISDLFARPPDGQSPVGVVSILIVLISVNSLGRSIRRIMERAWSLPSNGARGAVHGLIGVLLLVIVAGGVGWVWAEAHARLGLLAGVAAAVAFGTLGWLALLLLFLSRRHDWRLLLPGAIFGGAAQTLATWASSIYLPYLLYRNAERFGVIGVSVALVAWLVILSTVVVAVSVVSAQSARSLEQRSVSRGGPAPPPPRPGRA